MGFGNAKSNDIIISRQKSVDYIKYYSISLSKVFFRNLETRFRPNYIVVDDPIEHIKSNWLQLLMKHTIENQH